MVDKPTVPSTCERRICEASTVSFHEIVGWFYDLGPRGGWKNPLHMNCGYV